MGEDKPLHGDVILPGEEGGFGDTRGRDRARNKALDQVIGALDVLGKKVETRMRNNDISGFIRESGVVGRGDLTMDTLKYLLKHNRTGYDVGEKDAKDIMDEITRRRRGDEG